MIEESRGDFSLEMAQPRVLPRRALSAERGSAANSGESPERFVREGKA